MAFPADINGFIVNKVKVNPDVDTPLPLCFNKGAISVGISRDYNPYDESCNTGWYQGMWSATGSSIFNRSVVFSRKDPGGSLYFRDTQSNGILIDDPNDQLLLGTEKFTIEFWFKHDNTTTATTQYFVFGNVGAADTVGIVFFYNPSTTVFTVRAGDSSNWDVFSATTSIDKISWHHICLQRNIQNRIQFIVNGNVIGETTTNLLISSPTKKYSIGIATDLSTGVYSRARCRITNLRMLFGMAKYPITPITVPIYPISALGKSGGTINSKLMLNVRQPNSYLNNSGYANAPFSAVTSYPTWSDDSPFLYDIPSIFIGRSNNDLENIIRSTINPNFTQDPSNRRGSIMSAITYNNNIMIQNFVYPEIPTSGLTICLDSGHLTSYPYVENKTNLTTDLDTKWYNLVSTKNQVAVLDSSVTISSSTSGNTFFITNNTKKSVTISGMNISQDFTLLIITEDNYDNSGTIFTFGNGMPYNSGIEITQAGKNYTFNLYDNSAILADSQTITASGNANFIGIGYDGVGGGSTFIVDGNYIKRNQTISRDVLEVNTIFCENVGKNIYALLLYDRFLTETEVNIIRDGFRARIPIP